MSWLSDAVRCVKRRPIIAASALLLATGMVLAAIALLVFWYGESRRAHLIAAYEAPANFIDDLLGRPHGPASMLMHGGETIICAVGGYGRVEHLPALNEKQTASLPKSKLPSEDLAWYLLFFSADTVSRVYLIDSARLEANTEGSNAGCVDQRGRVEIRRDNGEDNFVLHLIK